MLTDPISVLTRASDHLDELRHEAACEQLVSQLRYSSRTATTWSLHAFVTSLVALIDPRQPTVAHG